MAPEVRYPVADETTYDRSVDSWSLGITISMMWVLFESTAGGD